MKSDKIRNNILPKIVSFAVAILLWNHVMSIENPLEKRTYHNIPVIFEGTDYLESQQLKLLSPDSMTISVTISGKKNDLDKFNSASINSSVDFKQFNFGNFPVSINTEILNNENSVEIVETRPKKIDVKIDRIIKKNFKIEINQEGNLLDNLLLDNISYDDNIIVTGPSSIIYKIDKVKVDLNLEEIAGKTELNLTPKVVDVNGNEVQQIDINKENVLLNFDIKNTKSVPIEFNSIGSMPSDRRLIYLEIEPNNILIKGSENLDSINSIKTKQISLLELSEKQGLIEAELEFPQNIISINATNKVKINYSIEQMEEKNFTLNTNSIEIDNLGQNRHMVFNTADTFTITLRAFPSTFEKINNDNFKFKINLNGLELGNHEVPIEFIKSIDTNDVLIIEPEMINITISNEESNTIEHNN